MAFGIMSDWSPITLSCLWDYVLAGEQEMDVEKSRLWGLVRVEFTKWQLHPWGDLGGGFWVVGLVGTQVLWYNDIEEGFNWSRYTKYGEIEGYHCNQSGLAVAMLHLQDILRGYGGLPQAGPPQDGEYREA